jgi:hypothetical protein
MHVRTVSPTPVPDFRANWLKEAESSHGVAFNRQKAATILKQVRVAAKQEANEVC